MTTCAGRFGRPTSGSEAEGTRVTSAHVLRIFSRRKGGKRVKVTLHVQNVQGQDCMFMHILARGSDPIVALTVDGRRC